MSFILSNKPLDSLEKKNKIYLKGDFIEKDKHLLIFSGILYPENQIDENQILIKIIENGIDFITNLKGVFCGIYYNIKKSLLYAFNDKYGYKDLFYAFDGDLFIISDKFSNIISAKKYEFKDVDINSIYEFLYFEYPLFDKTFIKTIKFLPLGTILKIEIDKNLIKKIQYYDYGFKIDKDLDLDYAINKLDILFNKAFYKIKTLFPPKTIFGLGLSGGMDSRLIAFYALKHNSEIKTFIFGERNSDATYISKKIAHLLKLEHYELGFKRNFYKYFDKSINYNPMMNVQYTWYYAIYRYLPKFDELLTGFNGDNQFGSHLRQSDMDIKTDDEFSKIIFKNYCEIKDINILHEFVKNDLIYSSIKTNIIKFSLNSSNSKYWQKKEEFNYKYRQRIFIKNNPSFNFFGLYEQISIFTNPELTEFLMKIPFEFRINRFLFYKYLRKKCPILLKIRAERNLPIRYKNFFLKFIYRFFSFIDNKFKTHLVFRKSHKQIWDWLSNYKPFSNYIYKLFTKKNDLFYNLFDYDKILELISKWIWNSDEIYLIFRFITIKLFLDKFQD